MATLEFVLPNFTVFACPRGGDVLLNYDDQIRRALPAECAGLDYQVFPARHAATDPETEIAPTDGVAPYAKRRLCVRCPGAAPGRVSIYVQNDGAGERIANASDPGDSLRKIISKVKKRWKWASALRFGDAVLDERLTIADIGIAAAETLVVVERVRVQIRYPDRAKPERLRVPARLADLDGLLAFLEENSKAKLPSRRLTIGGQPVTDIAQVYALPEDGVVVIEGAPKGPAPALPVIPSALPLRYRVGPADADARVANIALPEGAKVGDARPLLAVRPDFAGRTLQFVINGQPADNAAPLRGAVEIRFGLNLELLGRRRTIWLFADPALATVGALLENVTLEFGADPAAVSAKRGGGKVSADTNLIDLKGEEPLVIEGLDTAGGSGFRFRLPDGSITVKDLDQARTFASLVSEFPGFPPLQFFTEDTELQPSARLSSMVGQGLITVRILYEFMWRHWEEPRVKAFPPDVPVGAAAAELTGKSASEFVVTYDDNIIPSDSPLSSVTYTKGRPFVLTRSFPVKLQLDGSDDIIEQRFSDDCTFRLLREIATRDHPGFEPVFLDNWINDAEIYAVLDSKDVIPLKRTLDSDDWAMSDVIKRRQSTFSIEDLSLPAGETSGARRYEFKFLDDGSVRQITLPNEATVKDAARAVGRDEKHPIKLYVNYPGSPLTRSELLSQVVPEGAVVSVGVCQVTYSVQHGSKAAQIQMPDEATFGDLRAPALAALFENEQVAEGQLRFSIRSAKGVKKIKPVKESQTTLLQYWRPDLTIEVEGKDPCYLFKPPIDGEKLRKVHFSTDTLLSAVHTYWERKFGFPVQLSIGDKRLPRTDTPLVHVPGVNEKTVIVISRAAQKRVKVKYVIRLPGHTDLFVIHLDDRETVGKFLGRLTYDTPTRDSISIAGSGEPVNVMRVQIFSGGHELNFDDRLVSAAGGRSEADPLEVITLEHHFKFVIDNQSFQERIEPGQTIPAVGFFLSRRLNREVEIVSDDVFVIRGMLFEDLAQAIADTWRQSIQLRASTRRLYLFAEQRSAEKRLVRFDEFTQIREVKTVVCPEARFRHVRLTYRGEELQDHSTIGAIANLDPNEPILFLRRRRDAIDFVDDDGKRSSIVLEGRKRRLADVKKELGGAREVDLLLLGEEVRELKPSRRVPIRISAQTAEFTFSVRGSTVTREFPKSATVGSVESAFSEQGGRVLFAIDGVVLPVDATLASFAGATITVFPLPPGEEARLTVGDLRRAEPGARYLYTAGDRVLVNSDRLFVAGDITQNPSLPGPPRRFSFRLPFVPAWPELSNRIRAFIFDFDTTVKDVESIITDITRLSFPPYGLFNRGHLLLDDDFIFEIGYDPEHPIDVRLTRGPGDVLRVATGELKDVVTLGYAREDTVNDVKTRLSDEFGLPKDVELVSLGKVLYDEDTIDPASVPPESYLQLYARIDEEIIAEAPEIPTTFEFLIPRTHARLSLPFVAGKTVRDAKFDLSKKLLKPVPEIAIIDLAQMLLLQDTELLEKYQKGQRPFNIHFVDTDIDLSQDQIRLIQRCMPGRDVEEEGKELFLHCATNARVFQKTCKARGYS